MKSWIDLTNVRGTNAYPYKWVKVKDERKLGVGVGRTQRGEFVWPVGDGGGMEMMNRRDWTPSKCLHKKLYSFKKHFLFIFWAFINIIIHSQLQFLGYFIYNFGKHKILLAKFVFNNENKFDQIISPLNQIAPIANQWTDGPKMIKFRHHHALISDGNRLLATVL